MIEIRRARESDLPYIDKLQGDYTHELGFLPHGAISGYIFTHHVWIGLENGEPAAYVLGRGPSQTSWHGSHIVQACVQYDARKRALGSALVEGFLSGMPGHCDHAYLWCAQDIEANVFWEAVGFHAEAWRLGKKELERVHILWHRALHPDVTPSTFAIPETSKSGMMRKGRIVVPLERGQSWNDVKPENRPDVIVNAWGESPSKLVDVSAVSSATARKPRAKRCKQTSAPIGVPMVVGGRVVYRSTTLFAGRN